VWLPFCSPMEGLIFLGLEEGVHQTPLGQLRSSSSQNEVRSPANSQLIIFLPESSFCLGLVKRSLGCRCHLLDGNQEEVGSEQGMCVCVCLSVRACVCSVNRPCFLNSGFNSL
jgi:hypothetical protein